MSKLLHISNFSGAPATGGRSQLAQLHARALAELLGDRLVSQTLPQARPSGARSILAALTGAIDGVTPAAEQAVVKRLRDEGIERLWLDVSNLGRLARAVRKALPEVEILTFFHNVEARFFLGALRHRPSIRALAVLAANYAAERMAVRSSDRLITLNRRDGDLLKSLYGRAATDLLPMAIDARVALVGTGDGAVAERDYLLFVGGGFYANRAGILWFAREVAPSIELELRIVGRGLDDLRLVLEAAPNVRLIGAVDDLGPWYHRAKAVIAPIFDGSGMKTKVAEALMHGKPVIGTSEAFVGYDEVGVAAGRRCDTAPQFIAAIAELANRQIPPFDPASRLLFDRHYSFEAATDCLKHILG